MECTGNTEEKDTSHNFGRKIPSGLLNRGTPRLRGNEAMQTREDKGILQNGTKRGVSVWKRTVITSVRRTARVPEQTRTVGANEWIWKVSPGRTHSLKRGERAP